MSESSYTPSLERLAQYFRSLPGVGKKSSYRMAFSILDMPEEKAVSFVGYSNICSPYILPGHFGPPQKRLDKRKYICYN